MVINTDIFLNKNSLEEIRKLPDNSVQLILTDPPYGINYNNNRRKKDGRIKTENGILNDNNNIEFLKEIIKECYRVLEDGRHFYWFGRFDTLAEQIIVIRNAGFVLKNQLIWVKNNHGTGDLNSSYAGKYECIIFAIKKQKSKTKLYHLQKVDGVKRPPDVLFYDKVSSNLRIHDHQKPIDLLEFLIKKSTVENDIVLEPFAGSGSTIIATKNTNRKIIGYELDKELYDKAKENIINKGINIEFDN